MSPSIELDEATLAERANRGDRAAMTAYFAREMPRLRSIARGVAGGLLDPEDLLGDAIAAVIEKWDAANGPTTYVTAYLAQSMRNRVKDELRSPRSRVTTINDIDEPVVDDARARRGVEWHREHALVRRALRALPADQRTVLIGTVLHERKSGAMADELGRPAASVYSLLRRAKLRLRRTMLVEAITQRALGKGCLAAAKGLPDILPVDLDNAGDGATWQHVRSCSACSGAWQLYSSAATAHEAA